MNLQSRRSGRPHERTGLYRFSMLTVLAVVVLLLAGAAVKSTESGLAVPDWPLSFGQVMPPMEGGVFYEHGHRMIAAAVGVLTIVLALWFWIRDPRPAIRRLGWIALAVVIVQGVLGGVTVLLKLPTAVSAAHACLAQAYFGVVVFLALSVSRGWNTSPPLRNDINTALPTIAAATTLAIYLQLVIGAVVRHLNAALVIPDFPLAFGRLVPPVFTPEIAVHYAHRIGALVVAVLAAATAISAFRLRVDRSDFRTPAWILAALTVVQATLGAAIVLSQRHVHPTTIHVVVGALLLAASLVLTARAWKFIGVPGRNRERAHRPRPAPAAGLRETA